MKRKVLRVARASSGFRIGLLLILFCRPGLAQWQQVGNFTTWQINSLTIYGSGLYASVNSYGAGVYVTRNGTTWMPTSQPPFNQVVYGIAGSGSRLYAATGIYAYVSTDSGATWIARKTGLSSALVQSVCCRDTTVFVGTYRGICRSSANDSTWTALGTGLILGSCQGVLATDSRVFIGGGYTYVSGDNGQTWGSQLDQSSQAFVELDGTVFGGFSALFKLGPLDTAWIPIASPPRRTLALSTDGRNLFAGTWDGVFVSPDRGLTWTAVNEGLSARWVKSLAVWGSYLYAGTYDTGIWRRPLSEIVVEATLKEPVHPQGFELLQNFPNPFNPSTTIRYGLPERAHVTLSVFNTLGQQVAVLHNGAVESGYHEEFFDARGLPSGVYFYRLRAGNYSETKRLLFVQ